MARRKRKRKSRRGLAQSSAALRRNGLRAFEQRDYDRAIKTWEQVRRQTPKMQPTAALAEAYFRRGLNYLYGNSRNPEAGLSDVKQAARLASDDPCYAYHLGLAAHRQGDVDTAIRAYQIARQGQSEFAARAAYPLALALLQRGEEPSSTPAWSALSDKERAMLSQASAFRRRPYTLSPDVPLLWRGLVALDAGDRERAQATLNQILESSGNSSEGHIAHYYLGVLAAQDENWGEAGRQWSAARAAGLESPWLTENLGELYHRLAEERLLQDDDEGALAAATETARHKSGDKKLAELLAQIYQRIAGQAASAGDWEKALQNWNKASEKAGSSFRLAYNRALAYEHAEDFMAAGETWREALRRRPRRADHPDAVSDEQVARLWRRAAEAYRKAGEFEEATNVYRLALKWNPDDLQTRMTLAEGLLYDGRIQAAQNELNRILDRDPNNVPALLRLGETVAASDYWWYRGAAPRYWEQALKLDPDNATARQLLADFYQDLAEIALSWDDYRTAVRRYEQALKYQPKNARILAALGNCHFKLDGASVAQSYVEDALRNASTNLEVYSELIHVWLDQDDAGQAWEVMAQAEALVSPIPFDFYIAQGTYCIITDNRDLARPWFERAIEKAPADEPILLIIGEMVVMAGGASEIGREYLERAIKAKQMVGQAYLLLGMVAAWEGDMRTAKKHWNEAEKIAYRNRDADLQGRVGVARTLLGGPRGLVDMLLQGPAFLDDIGPLGGMDLPDFLYDEEDYEDEFFGP